MKPADERVGSRSEVDDQILGLPRIVHDVDALIRDRERVLRVVGGVDDRERVSLLHVDRRGCEHEVRLGDRFGGGLARAGAEGGDAHQHREEQEGGSPRQGDISSASQASVALSVRRPGAGRPGWSPVLRTGYRTSLAPRSQPRVHARVGQPVGLAVQLARDVLEADLPERPSSFPNLAVQPDQPGVLDPVATRKLLHQKLAVRAKEHFGRAEGARPAQSLDRRSIFGHVVRGDADAFADLGQNPSAGPEYHDPDAGRARIPTSRAVAIDDQSKIRILWQCSHLRMPSVRLSRSRYIGDSCWWQPWHTPSISAAAPTPFF